MDLHYYRQQRDYWCGPACVQMLLSYRGKQESQATLARQMCTNRVHGTSRTMLRRAMRKRGLPVHVERQGTFRTLARNLPAIVNYQEVGPGGEDHYAVVLRVTARHVVMHDPWHGKYYKLSHKLFLRHWKNQKLRKKYTGWFVAVC